MILIQLQLCLDWATCVEDWVKRAEVEMSSEHSFSDVAEV